MKWRLINSGLMRAADNMAIDEAILLAQEKGEVPPTLRLYGWKPPAVSLGYFQSYEKEIDPDECLKRGFDVVRRLTGGRAVLHDSELTYSIIVRENCPLVPKTITASYHFFSRGLVAGLERLGLAAKVNTPAAAYGQRKKSHSSAACFDAPAHYEITVDGRKLAGSAQVRKGSVILQHGSVLLDFSPQDVAAVLKLPAEMKHELAIMLDKKAISLSQAMRRQISWEQVAKAMAAAFGPALGVEFEAGELTEYELYKSRELAAVKYGKDEWNMLR